LIKSGHPWLFDNSIVKQSREGNAGDTAIIFDNRYNKFLALGLYDPDSPIRVKILSTQNGTKVNQDWFVKKFESAFNKRSALLRQDVNAYRLCFGENDGLPSLICDVYNGVAILKIYSRIWLPFLDQIKDAIVDAVNCSCIVLRFSRSVEKDNTSSDISNGKIIYGELESEEVLFTEHGVRFTANVIHGHKTGFFLDHRYNRYKIQQLAKGKTVLDVFSYAGGFAVHALVGGATAVTAVDISKQALAIANKNATLNNVKLNTIAGDAFKVLKDLIDNNQTFDIVIIDPPAFAKAAKEIPTALNQYRRLAKLGIELVSKKGILLLASCSSRVAADAFYETIEQGMKNSRKSFSLIEKTFHDTDHPIGFTEGAYLKSAYYKIS